MLRAARTQVLVGEPSVADTIQILRGISDKYASFHGVRVQDRALVAAAELSERYIQARFRAFPPPLLALYSLYNPLDAWSGRYT